MFFLHFQIGYTYILWTCIIQIGVASVTIYGLLKNQMRHSCLSYFHQWLFYDKSRSSVDWFIFFRMLWIKFNILFANQTSGLVFESQSLIWDLWMICLNIRIVWSQRVELNNIQNIFFKQRMHDCNVCLKHRISCKTDSCSISRICHNVYYWKNSIFYGCLIFKDMAFCFVLHEWCLQLE